MASNTQNSQLVQDDRAATPLVQSRSVESTADRTIKVIRLRVTEAQRDAIASAIRIGKATGSSK